ncbi:hypothetical protein [Aneurinibacillus migulanus]|uniref:hypothetical protein n=1 Tax=Aneurinibacillus migulanus TaxID=47500 RepID=UPI001F1863DB|nr:hypothetical protein [Aneurinibacillus migulanus]
MIHRKILVVRGKKRRKDGRRERSEKDILAFLLLERRAHPPSSLFRISSFQPRYPVKISSVIYIERLSSKDKSSLLSFYCKKRNILIFIHAIHKQRIRITNKNNAIINFPNIVLKSNIG